jgi:hypothetical protein
MGEMSSEATANTPRTSAAQATALAGYVFMDNLSYEI